MSGVVDSADRVEVVSDESGGARAWHSDQFSGRHGDDRHAAGTSGVTPRLRANDGEIVAKSIILRAVPRIAIASLHAELILSPKPGLVCPDDVGSHDDMDATTMMRSVAALRHGFVALTVAAAGDAPFARLQSIGVAAEAAMLRATGGVNTHRGAIFTVGLLAAAAAHRVTRGLAPTDDGLRATLRANWGRALAARPVVGATHGRAVAAAHGVGGARREGVDAFPSVFGIVLPALRAARRAGCDERHARLQALMTAIAEVDDTNLLHRGGVAGLRFAQAAARDFLDTRHDDRAGHDAALRAIGRAFVARRLSPGGSADLLAAALFVEGVQAAFRA